MSKRAAGGEFEGAETKYLRAEGDADGQERPSDEERRRSQRKVAPRRALKHEKLPVVMYKPGDTFRTFRGGPMTPGLRLEVRIAPNYMSNTNQQVRARQLWGNEVYTEDSDLVAALMHTGFYSIALPSAPQTVAELRAVVALMPPLQHYPSASRHSIRSRAWGATLQGCSFKIERAWLVTVAGASVELEAGTEGAHPAVPTFSPVGQERSMHTRATASAVDRRTRIMPEVTVQYNLCNEPWTKYSMAGVADRGLSPSQWTSARLRKQVLYVETHRNRFELSRIEVAEGSQDKDVYRWARCVVPHSAAAMQGFGTPLPESQLADIQKPLNWEDLQWGPTGVHVKGKFYALARLHYVKRREPAGTNQPKGDKPQAADEA